MSLKGKFKQPLYKEDLMPVIKQGIFVALVGGLLIGSVDLLTSFISSWSFVRMFWIIMAILLARRIKQSYYQYHIWYSVLAIAFFVLGVYLINVVSQAGVLIILNITEPMAYVSILNPIIYFQFLFPIYLFFASNAAVFLQWALDILFFGISIFYVYKYSK